MKIKNKSRLIEQLSREVEPISLPELLKKLPEALSARSVRRWLNELVEEGKIKKIGKKRSTQYSIVREGSQHKSGIFSHKSGKVIEWIKRPIYEREPATYKDEWLKSYTPNKTFYLSKKIRIQLKEAGRRLDEHDPAGTYAHQIFNQLLIDLSYNSSRLEGNTYSLLETERLLLKGIDAEGKLDEEKIMIINHKEAIRYLVDHAGNLQPNLETIFTLHYLLSDGLIEAKYSGKIRDQHVRIGGSTYLPLVNQKQLKIHLGRIAEIGIQIQDSFEQSLFFLAHVSYLQAFIDVNKRTARLTANIPLISKNYVPLSFNDVERGDYNSAMLALYELQDLQPLIELYVFSYLRTCAAYDVTVQALGFDQIRVRYRQFRRRLIRQVIEQQLVGSKIEAFIKKEVKETIPQNDQAAFIEDVKEDLEQIDHSRLAGLGITPTQLDAWLRA